MQQKYVRSKGRLHHLIRSEQGVSEAEIDNLADKGLTPCAAWWQSVLRGARPTYPSTGSTLRIVDAFCGSGGLGLGITQAAEATGRKVEFSAFIDTDQDALLIHRLNLGGRLAISDSAASLVDYHVSGAGHTARFAYHPEITHKDLGRVRGTDLFIAGPPCQGHSNLNNHTRREDPRNALYLTAVALGVALNSKAILIENVPTVVNDANNVVETAKSLLKNAGYGVCEALLRADLLGAAQRRMRYFILAVKNMPLASDYLSQIAEGCSLPAMPLSWAIGDLINEDKGGLFDTSPILNPTNQSRIDYLFARDLYDLPDTERPDCHKNGTTYSAVYGRMHWDKPAHTITTGFGTPGQGRYVHSIRKRVITPHEAARIQGYPDWFQFMHPDLKPTRKRLAKWIGDAVHPILGYTAGLAVISALNAEKLESIAA